MPAWTERRTPEHPAFTLAQLGVVVSWDGTRPFGLSAKIIADDPEFLELAEIFQGNPPQLRYRIRPTEQGTVVLSRQGGGEWELPSIECALTRLLMLEELSGQG